MIQSIIGDIICLQRLEIIGVDRLETGNGGYFTKDTECCWTFSKFGNQKAFEKSGADHLETGIDGVVFLREFFHPTQ